MVEAKGRGRDRVIGVVANIEKAGAAELLPRLRESFARHGLETVFERETARLADFEEAGRELRETADAADVLLVLGGDGTILSVVDKLGKAIKPLAAINIGTLGFLTCATTDDLDSVAAAIAEGKYALSPRRMLEVAVADAVAAEGVKATHYALNEAALSRSEVSRMITLEARIDGEFFSNYSGDGLIIATPTGSTAYSFSAGGAIVDPAADVTLLTPICPHALANRSVVLPRGSVIEVTPQRENHQVALTIDGRFIQEIPCGSPVRVSEADFDLPLIMMPGQTFYEILREKLRWQGSNV